MCGRFAIYADLPVVARFVQAPEPEFDWTPRYNLAPTQSALACRLDATQQKRELVRLRWGLVPSWAHDLAIGVKAINARAEGIAAKPMFRAAFKRRRCLIPVNGYYEWQKRSGKKQPYFIHAASGALLAFAGLWESWQGEEGPVESFTIITTEANRATNTLHDRMPVVLPSDLFAGWLDPAATDAERLGLLRPCPDEWLAFHPVDARVGNVKHDAAGLIEPRTDLFTA